MTFREAFLDGLFTASANTSAMLGAPRAARGIYEALAPLAEDIELAYQEWNRQYCGNAEPQRFLLGATE